MQMALLRPPVKDLYLVSKGGITVEIFWTKNNLFDGPLRERSVIIAAVDNSSISQLSSACEGERNSNDAVQDVSRWMGGLSGSGMRTAGLRSLYSMRSSCGVLDDRSIWFLIQRYPFCFHFSAFRTVLLWIATVHVHIWFCCRNVSNRRTSSCSFFYIAWLKSSFGKSTPHDLTDS